MTKKIRVILELHIIRLLWTLRTNWNRTTKGTDMYFVCNGILKCNGASKTEQSITPLIRFRSKVNLYLSIRKGALFELSGYSGIVMRRMLNFQYECSEV